MRGRRRTVVAGIALAAAVLAVLAGCGVIGESYKYIEWSTSYFEKYYPRWMDDFAREHADENVRITLRAMVSDSAQKVYTMLISHTLSDIIIVGTETQALLLDNRALVEVPEGYIDRDDYMPLTLSVHSYPDGPLAAIPNTVGIRPFMYFNVEHLKEVGTSVEEVPESFGEYHKWASRFLKWEAGPDKKPAAGSLEAQTAADAKVVRRPLLLQRGHVLSVFPFILAYLAPEPDADGKSDHSLDDFLGGPPSNRPFRFDTAEFTRGLTEWQRFFISDTGAIADGDEDRIQGLTGGIYSSCEAGNWIFGEVYSVNMQVTALPHADAQPLRLPMNVGSYGISQDSKHKELAMEYARYVSGAERQLDGYYGHGYLPCRFSAWEGIRADDEEDARIRERFLGGFRGGNADFVAEPRIKRTYHDRMEIYLYVPFNTDVTIARAISSEAVLEEEEEETKPAEGEEEDEATIGRAKSLAGKYGAQIDKLARDIAEMSGQDVMVRLQGTPDEMVALRSVIAKSPVDVYIPHLAAGVYVPVHRLWGRLQSEVIVRAQQFVTQPDAAQRMTPEEAAKWCQEEAEQITAGKK